MLNSDERMLINVLAKKEEGMYYRYRKVNKVGSG